MEKEVKPYSQLLEAKRIGINESHVDECTDIYKLLNWQIEISKDVANITAQLQKNKLMSAEAGYEVDPEWIQRANASKDLLSIFIQKINVRVSEVKTKRAHSLAEAFFNIAKQMMDKNDFDDVFTRATQKLRSAS